MARYKRSYGMRRKARTTGKSGRYARMLLTQGANALGQLGDYSLTAGQRMQMFGPSFKQRLLQPNVYNVPPTARQIIARRGFNYRGDGDYGSTGNQYGLFNFGSGGGIQGNKITGVGDYAGDAGGNQIMQGSTQTPMTVNASTDLSGDIYFSHREFVGNIYTSVTVSQVVPATSSVAVTGSSGYNNQQFPINVGLAGSFPWLSQTASNFTLYKLEGCIFEYKPTSGEFGVVGSNNLGKVIMATNYDPEAPAFTNSTTMENYDYATACKPSERMVHGIETKTAASYSNNLYIRTGPPVKNRIFTDIGLFQLATEGIPFSTTLSNGTASAATVTKVVTPIIGELWVTYRVKLSRAQIFDAAGLNIKYDLYSNVSDSANNQLWPLPGTLKVDTQNSNTWTVQPHATGDLIPTNSGGTYVFSAGTDLTLQCDPTITTGTYMFTIYYATTNATDLATIGFALQSTTNNFCTVAPQKNSSGSGTATQLQIGRVPTTQTRCFSQFIITVNAPLNNVANFTIANSTAGSNAYVKIMFTQINPNVVADLATV